MARQIDSEWGSLERQILDITINAPPAQQKELRETVQTLRREHNRHPPPSIPPPSRGATSPGVHDLRQEVWDTEARAVRYHQRCTQVDAQLMQSRANQGRLAKEQDDLQARFEALQKERVRAACCPTLYSSSLFEFVRDGQKTIRILGLQIRFLSENFTQPHCMQGPSRIKIHRSSTTTRFKYFLWNDGCSSGNYEH